MQGCWECFDNFYVHSLLYPLGAQMFPANKVFVSGPNSPRQNRAPYSYLTHVALHMDEYSEENVVRGGVAFIGRVKCCT